MAIESIISYALHIREIRRAGPTNLELALAPTFQRLLEAVLPKIFPNPPVVVPEFTRPGVGRPDIAFVRPGQPPRAFIELKSPEKPGDPARYRDPHDRRQFDRFQSLPIWAVSNFASLRVFRLSALLDAIEIVPEAALDPTTSNAKAERLIRGAGSVAFMRALSPLALAEPPPRETQRSLRPILLIPRGSSERSLRIGLPNLAKRELSIRPCKVCVTSFERHYTRIQRRAATKSADLSLCSLRPSLKPSFLACCSPGKPATARSITTLGDTCRMNTL